MKGLDYSYELTVHTDRVICASERLYAPIRLTVASFMILCLAVSCELSDAFTFFFIMGTTLQQSTSVLQHAAFAVFHTLLTCAESIGTHLILK